MVLTMLQREPEEVLEDEAAVARLVGVRPEGAAAGLLAQEALALLGREVRVYAPEAARQVLERLLQVELHGVDELPFSALDHHLVAAQVGRGEQVEARGHAVELEAVVLPDPQDGGLVRVVRPRAGAALAYAAEDGVCGVGDAYEAVLVLELPALAPLGGLQVVERDAARAEAEADELVSAADAEHRDLRPHDPAGEAADHLRVVVVEVRERAAQDDGLRAKLLDRLDSLREVYDASLWLLDETRDVADDVLDGERGDVALAFELRGSRLAPLPAREVGEVRLVAQERVDDEDADRADALLDRLVVAEGALAVGEGERVRLFVLRLLGRLWRRQVNRNPPC